jgi:2-C-methyl-D-erythritol 4-phosphate cytidylyltransferase
MGPEELNPIYRSTWVVVVAAGDGSRFGGRKQFAEINGRPVVAICIEAARSVAAGLVLVVPPAVGREDLPAIPGGIDAVVTGGATRSDSVGAGLRSVPGAAEVVVVHDAARPLASPGLFKTVVNAVLEGADAAIPGLAISDTLKRVEGDLVLSTVERDGLVTVQTPQAFRAGLLREAHSKGAAATDDAALVEALGATVRIVPGESSNLKLTSPGDLRLLESLMGR